MYTGMAIEPVINVTRYVNGEIIKLERDKDYTVEYANNIEVTGSGEKASITVTGIGNYIRTEGYTFRDREESCV